MRLPGRRSVAAGLAAIVGISVALVWGTAAYSNGERGSTGSHRPAMRQVGYFVQWGIYGRSFFVKNLDTSGEASKLTDLDYAFANVAPEGTDVTCQSGDAWADYQRPVPAEESVDGVADQRGEPLNGNFGQLLKLKAKYPDLKVLLSLGGWSWSKYFSDAALTPQSRAAFVSSCVDRFIKGNLPSLGPGDAGGPGSAAGVFDGIDVDWEWPGASGNVGNIVRPEDKANLTLLLKEFRRQLDAYGTQTNKHYELSAFLPADPAKIAAGFDGRKIFSSLDYGNVQGYDFHGTWESATNQQSAIRLPSGAPAGPDFSIDSSVQGVARGGRAPRSARDRHPVLRPGVDRGHRWRRRAVPAGVWTRGGHLVARKRGLQGPEDVAQPGLHGAPRPAFRIRLALRRDNPLDVRRSVGRVREGALHPATGPGRGDDVGAVRRRLDRHSHRYHPSWTRSVALRPWVMGAASTAPITRGGRPAGGDLRPLPGGGDEDRLVGAERHEAPAGAGEGRVPLRGRQILPVRAQPREEVSRGIGPVDDTHGGSSQHRPPGRTTVHHGLFDLEVHRRHPVTHREPYRFRLQEGRHVLIVPYRTIRPVAAPGVFGADSRHPLALALGGLAVVALAGRESRVCGRRADPAKTSLPPAH